MEIPTPGQPRRLRILTARCIRRRAWRVIPLPEQIPTKSVFTAIPSPVTSNTDYKMLMGVMATTLPELTLHYDTDKPVLGQEQQIPPIRQQVTVLLPLRLMSPKASMSIEIPSPALSSIACKIRMETGAATPQMGAKLSSTVVPVVIVKR